MTAKLNTTRTQCGVTVAEDGGMVYALTACCSASVTGTDKGAACRACYKPVGDWMGHAGMVDAKPGVTRAYTALMMLAAGAGCPCPDDCAQHTLDTLAAS